MSDISDYYSHKLEVIGLRRQQLRLCRPDSSKLRLAAFLKKVYGGHPNREELWQDMFARLRETGIAINFAVWPE